MTVCIAQAVFLLSAPAQTGRGACPGLTAETPVVRLVGLDANGDLLLDDGRTVRLVGLAPRQDDAEAARFAGAVESWRDREVGLVVLAQKDRWGRLPARLLAMQEQPGAELVDLAVALLRAKAALRLPEPAHPGCDALLRAALGETTQKPVVQVRGVIVGPAPAPIAASSGTDSIDGLDLPALKAQAGRIVVVEGRVVSVGERPQRSYLNFSRQRGGGGAIVVSRRLWREMQDAGWTSTALTGRRVRARGLLGGQDGLLLEAASLAAMELID